MSAGEDSTFHRDYRRVRTNLERLFDWAGTRNKPMSESNLLSLRSQVTSDLDRIVDRGARLERAPSLISVSTDAEGIRTVVMDMKDGTTRSFQTRVDWIDSAISFERSDVVDVGTYEDQSRLLDREVDRAESAEVRVSSEAERADAAEALVEKVRAQLNLYIDNLDECKSLLTEARKRVAAAAGRVSHQTERADAAENQARTVEAQLNRSEEKLEECEQRLSSLVGERDRADRADSLVADLESKLENCKEQHKAAVKVIDDALPAISEYLETISTDAPS